MGNPLKDNDMEQHTRQKVAIYDAYLKRYLKIILQSRFKKVCIFDPFAGIGKYGEHDGSAVVACNNALAHKRYGKDIHIHLNEVDPTNHGELLKTCNYDFVKCVSNKDANSFIKEQCKTDPYGHSLWFIDPYGYTQVTRESISKIMGLGSSEVLLFIPLTFIYRFLKGNLENPNLQAIANFLEDYSINQSDAKSCMTPPQFADLIAHTLQKQYGWSWHATMQEGGLFYSLVFISNHHYGLEKFLEARDSILNDTDNLQLSLIPMGKERDLLELLPQNTTIDNCKLYPLALNNGFRPCSARSHLMTLEARNLIHVQKRTGIRRGKGHFFIGKNYYETNDKRIDISVPLEQVSLF